MIILSDKTPFAAGGHRLCFVHPDDPNKCVKVLRADKRDKMLRHRRRFPRNLRSAEDYDDNAREARGYAYVRALRSRRVWRHVPRYYGFAETDLGRAGVSRLIRDYDGAISGTLLQRLRRDPDALHPDSPCARSVREFAEFLRQTRFLSRDLAPSNILSQRVAEGRECLRIIDGIGAQRGIVEWIPLARFLPPLADWKIRRIIERFERRIKMEMESNA